MHSQRISCYENICCVEINLIEPETVLSRLHCVSLLYKATMEAESRFASLNAQDFEALVADKD